ncbi:MAG: Methyltransferase type 11, partial [Acidimicrobiales bacterium]|nr:Methyltransferase type 11 [Acidimicrobiales bacterium]
KGLAVDDPRTTALRRDIIRDKAFLRRLYGEWYGRIVQLLEDRQQVLELGSGAGFFIDYLPHAVTSEVFETPGVRLVADACQLPIGDGALDAIVMTDVFHHIPHVQRFLDEAARCVRPGGRVVMIEPWRTPWSQWVYTHLHHEPFVPDGDWSIPPSGPLSGANGALPWIVFSRDQARFAQQHAQWRVCRIEPMMPLAYLLSGGVSMRSLLPGWMYPPVRALERWLGQTRWAMFALIELERLP